jgi:hypothetical protein
MTEIERGKELALSGKHAPRAEEIPFPTEPPDIGDAPPFESSSVDSGGSSAGQGEKEPRKSVAVQLVELARSDYALGITDDDRPFGVNRSRPHIALMLRGGKTGLRAELARRYFADHNVVPSQQALADACMVLEGYAAQQPPQPVHLRVADAEGAVYVDMGGPAARVIEISHGTWKIVDTAPVLFRRTKLTAAMPHPHPGDLSQLWEFVPIAEADRTVLLAFLVAALVQVDVPHPILALLAEQGSAKSTITRFLVDLLDPSPVPLRKPPRDADSWVTAASASWVVGLDNLSGTPPAWLSDSLCRASTGDGDVRRQLYTDDDVAPFSFRRVVIVNGIDFAPGPEQGDLAERLVVVDLQRPSTRRREDDLAEAWRLARSHLLGGLLTLAAKVHYLLPSVEIEDMPRMADFAAVLTAVDQVLDTQGMARYRERSQRIAADTLDTPLIAELVRQNYDCADQTSAQILAALKPTDTDWKPPREWPKNARAVTAQLTRHAPALRTQGWMIDNDDGRNKRNVALWTIEAPENGEKSDSPPSPTSREAGSARSGSVNGVELSASHEDAIPRHPSPTSPTEPPLTSEYEVASQASQKTEQPLVSTNGSLPVPGCPCGRPAPVDPDTGRCHYCALKAGKVLEANR